MPRVNELVWDERLSEADKRLVAALNTSAETLSGQRAMEINVAGHFARSKIAWKLAVYQHALLHRIVALMEGATVAWNNRCTLSAILSARALMETVAVMAGFEDRVTDLLAKKDLGELDALAMRATYASRDPEWINNFPESQAVNVLTYVDKFDKRIPGFRTHYDILSERCHPNSLGHNFMFATLDQSDCTVRFSEEREPGRNAQMILAAFAPLPIVEPMMGRLDDLILKVSEFHHSVSPVCRTTS